MTYLKVPHGGNKSNTVVYIWKLLLSMNRAEWMKGICHIWSRGRHFSPSMPGDRYLKLGSKSDHRAEISGNIVRYDALAPRPEVLRLISCLYANSVLWVFFGKSANFLEVIHHFPPVFLSQPSQNYRKCLCFNTLRPLTSHFLHIKDLRLF